ncbi:alpha-hydroxy-acid oxidizing protein [Alteribacter natronophilus]|uniref:alpha-hydroxy-acid oxidizing protein n=1 Tax=Alteribacter natronophilus TaxID=2583810 RepID=UPI00110F0C10|nr:alpha-hydroxy-acid oxidizing protein [Alteribacter natronophilus]TMW71268.1 alpha-hydroxy-acid oxidizing protein [Alteribacter natronophilus]
MEVNRRSLRNGEERSRRFYWWEKVCNIPDGSEIVSIGRLYAYALTFGEEGVREVLGNLVRDLDINLALTGATSVSQLDQSILKKRTSL